MSQAATVIRLAVRELWITFRLVVLLAAFVGAGTFVALAPAAPAVTLAWLALGLALATLFASALAAWSLADARGSGRAGWVVTRSVSRATYLVGWFGALWGVTLVGIAGAATLGWLTASLPGVELDATEFVAVTASIATGAGAAIAAGLLIGAVAPPRIASAVAVVSSAAIGAVALALPRWADLLPGGAYLLLPRLLPPGELLPDALRATGSGLGLAAILLAAARVAMERAEL